MTVVRVNLDPDALTLTIVAEFDEPAEQVWQVWADPRMLEQWWGPPGFPATMVDHDLTTGGRVTYFMTGPDGDVHHGWWRVIDVDPPHSLTFEDGFTDASGQPDGDPASSLQVRLTSGEGAGTTMTIVMRFASIADMERIIATGTDKGIALAVGQIEAVLAAPPGR